MAIHYFTIAHVKEVQVVRHAEHTRGHTALSINKKIETKIKQLDRIQKTSKYKNIILVI